jgi:putative membrane protein
MRTLAILVVVCLALLGSVKAQSIGEKTGINAALGVSPSSADFIKQVAIRDMFEIEAGNLALLKGDIATKQFARKMISDHTKTAAELKATVQDEPNAALPDALDSGHQSKLDKLKSLEGAGFVREYRSQQVSAHKDAIALFQRYVNGGDNAKLRKWAEGMLPALQHHLTMAEALNKEHVGS